jgi:hypothetical protein
MNIQNLIYQLQESQGFPEAKDAPNFELKIRNCYINAAYAEKAKIRILKYLETKYPLYITDDIKHIAKYYAINYERFEKIKYLNRNVKVKGNIIRLGDEEYVFINQI